MIIVYLWPRIIIISRYQARYPLDRKQVLWASMKSTHCISSSTLRMQLSRNFFVILHTQQGFLRGFFSVVSTGVIGVIVVGVG